MRASHFLFGTVVGVMLITVVSCAGREVPGTSVDETVGSYDQLLVALRATGRTANPAGTVSQPFFGPKGQVISLDGQEVQVFEFPTEEQAKSAAETISPDGSSIGTSMVSWVAAPHFYRAGKLVVLYVGEDESVVAALKDALGPQIAGR
jgi:hypothetical protein